RRHTRFSRDWSSDVCSSDLGYCWSVLFSQPLLLLLTLRANQQVADVIDSCFITGEYHGGGVHFHDDGRADDDHTRSQALTLVQGGLVLLTGIVDGRGAGGRALQIGTLSFEHSLGNLWSRRAGDGTQVDQLMGLAQ